MTVAITRKVSPAIAACELTHVSREPIDLDLAREQHAGYVRLLKSLGCDVVELPAEPSMPDSVFVEDTAIVLDGIAVITRPGAPSRQAETASIMDALRPYRSLAQITAPGTLDGGDVVRVARTLYVGASGRSNSAGIDQLRRMAAPHGYSVVDVPVHGCLHLKSAITEVAEGTLLVNREWVSAEPFLGHELIDIAEGETHAANALRLGQSVVYPSRFGKTASRLRDRGIDLHLVSLSELAKAEGAVTCCSLILDAP